jgi:hypothetical protein
MFLPTQRCLNDYHRSTKVPCSYSVGSIMGICYKSLKDPELCNAPPPLPRLRPNKLVGENSVLRIRIRILLSSCKNSKNNIDSYYFVNLFDFLSLENYVNVPSKSNKQKNLC